MNNQIAFAGIDVAFAKGKKLPVCVVTQEGDRLVPIALRDDHTLAPPVGKGNPALLDPAIVSRFGQDVLKYLQTIERDYNLKIAAIAIDAPREYKEGSRRACERAMDQLGISCFATPSRTEFEKIGEKAKKHLAAGLPVPRLPHANQLWMLAGFEVFTGFWHFKCTPAKSAITIDW